MVEGATSDVREGDITEVSIEDDEKNPLNVFFWSTLHQNLIKFDIVRVYYLQKQGNEKDEASAYSLWLKLPDVFV